MNILVTGGVGFIGSHTSVELIRAGHEVSIVDDLSNARPSVIDRIERITGVKPALHVVDVRDEAALEPIVAEGSFEAVVHFAALKAVGESTEKPLDYYDVNVGGTSSLLRVLDRHGVRTFVFSSSCTVYGDSDVLPVTEDMPTRPAANPYGRTKQIVEQMLIDVHAADPRWRIAMLRYFNPVGAHPSGMIGEDPKDRPNNLMPLLARVAAGTLSVLEVFGGDYPTRDGTGIRDFIHVVDLSVGHVAAVEYLNSNAGVHVWNLGTGSGTTVLELVAAFEEACGAEIPYRIVDRRPGDVAASFADPSKARRELGWRTERDIGDMCADSWRWQQYASGLDGTG